MKVRSEGQLGDGVDDLALIRRVRTDTDDRDVVRLLREPRQGVHVDQATDGGVGGGEHLNQRVRRSERDAPAVRLVGPLDRPLPCSGEYRAYLGCLEGV